MFSGGNFFRCIQLPSSAPLNDNAEQTLDDFKKFTKGNYFNLSGIYLTKLLVPIN